jgi:hypothetical protein
VTVSKRSSLLRKARSPLEAGAKLADAVHVFKLFTLPKVLSPM